VRLAIGSTELAPQYLHAGADGQHGRPAVDGALEAAQQHGVAQQGQLGGVLPTPDDQNPHVVGHLRPGPQGHHLGGDTAPLQPADQDHGVAAVAVGPEQVGTNQADTDRGGGAFTGHGPAPIATCWKAL